MHAQISGAGYIRFAQENDDVIFRIPSSNLIVTQTPTIFEPSRRRPGDTERGERPWSMSVDRQGLAARLCRTEQTKASMAAVRSRWATPV